MAQGSHMHVQSGRMRSQPHPFPFRRRSPPISERPGCTLRVETAGFPSEIRAKHVVCRGTCRFPAMCQWPAACEGVSPGLGK